MVERYTCTLDDYSDPRMAHNPKGGYVEHSDYAALEAERDEWKRRCEKIHRLLSSETFPDSARQWRNWIAKIVTNCIAIAEGRDNG